MYLCQTRKVHQCQAEHVRRVDLEINRLPVDALVVTCNSSCFVLNFPFYVLKVGKSSVGDVMELGPFWLRCDAGWRMRDVYLITILHIIFSRNVDQLKDKRPPSHNATSSGKKISADDVFENGRLSGRLRTNDHLDAVLVCVKELFLV
jgi:hypothetical protein